MKAAKGETSEGKACRGRGKEVAIENPPENEDGTETMRLQKILTVTKSTTGMNMCS